MQSGLHLSGEDTNHWIEVFEAATKNVISSQQVHQNLVLYVRRLKSQICVNDDSSEESDLNLGTLDQVIESQIFQSFYESVKRVILEKVQHFSKEEEQNRIRIKRMKLYLEDATKASSLMLRLASILSLHCVDEFEFDEDELELAMKSASLNEDGFISVPDEMVAAGYVVTKRVSVYDDVQHQEP